MVAPARLLAERREVVQPQQVLGGRVHGVDVERPRLVSTVSRRRSGSAAAGSVAEPVEVAAPQRREPGVEARPAATDTARTTRSAGSMPRSRVSRRLLGRAVRPSGQSRPGQPGQGRGGPPGRARGRPASVRPATVSRTGSGLRSSVVSAADSSPSTVRSPGWAAQPEKSVPSYAEVEPDPQRCRHPPPPVLGVGRGGGIRPAVARADTQRRAALPAPRGSARVAR